MPDTSEGEGGGVVGRLEPFTWSSRDAVRYEVALELLAQLVAACTQRIEQEHQKPAPDPAVLEQCDRWQEQFLQQRRALRPEDREGIEAVLATARGLDRLILAQE